MSVSHCECQYYLVLISMPGVCFESRLWGIPGCHRFRWSYTNQELSVGRGNPFDSPTVKDHLKDKKKYDLRHNVRTS